MGVNIPSFYLQCHICQYRCCSWDKVQLITCSDRKAVMIIVVTIEIFDNFGWLQQSLQVIVHISTLFMAIALYRKGRFVPKIESSCTPCTATHTHTCIIALYLYYDPD